MKCHAPFLVRQANGDSWEVEVFPNKWLLCETKDDAIAISNVPVLHSRCFPVNRRDNQLASELERVVSVLIKYNIQNFIVRFFSEQAKIFRGEISE